MWHTLTFSAMSSVIWCSFMSSQMLPIYIFLAHPSLSLHLNYISNIFLVVSSLSFFNTWPCHLSGFCLKKVVIGSMLASFQMSSFLMWPFFVLPLAHLSILISVVWTFCVSFSWPPSIQTHISLLVWLWFCEIAFVSILIHAYKRRLRCEQQSEGGLQGAKWREMSGVMRARKMPIKLKDTGLQLHK